MKKTKIDPGEDVRLKTQVYFAPACIPTSTTAEEAEFKANSTGSRRGRTGKCFGNWEAVHKMANGLGEKKN